MSIETYLGHLLVAVLEVIQHFHIFRHKLSLKTAKVQTMALVDKLNLCRNIKKQ